MTKKNPQFAPIITIPKPICPEGDLLNEVCHCFPLMSED